MKLIGKGLFVAVFLFGLYALSGVVSQAREDYQNFRKIVTWVALKQQQEDIARQRQLQARPIAPASAPEAGK